MRSWMVSVLVFACALVVLAPAALAQEREKPPGPGAGPGPGPGGAERVEMVLRKLVDEFVAKNNRKPNDREHAELKAKAQAIAAEEGRAKDHDEMRRREMDERAKKEHEEMRRRADRAVNAAVEDFTARNGRKPNEREMEEIHQNVKRNLEREGREGGERDGDRRMMEERARMEAEHARMRAEMERAMDEAVRAFIEKHDRKPNEKEMGELRRRVEDSITAGRGGGRPNAEEQARRDARAKEILTWLKANDPGSAEQVAQAMEKSPDDFWAAFPRLVHHVESMQQLQKSDPEAFKLVMEERKLERTSVELAKKYRESPADARESVEKEMKQVLSQLFDLREKMRAREIAELERKIAELRERIAKRKELKDDIVRRRLNELLGRDDETDW